MQTRTEISQLQRLSKKADIFGSIYNQKPSFLKYRILKSIGTTYITQFTRKLAQEASVVFSHSYAFLKCCNSAIPSLPGKSIRVQSMSGKNNNQFYISDQHAISQRLKRNSVI